MTPEQIEVGGYYSVDIGEFEGVQFRVTSVNAKGARGIIIYADELLQDEGVNIDWMKPSTHEAFNAAVDRVARAVKGE